MRSLPTTASRDYCPLDGEQSVDSFGRAAVCLSSSSVRSIVQKVRELLSIARSGVAIAFTVHQPSTAVRRTPYTHTTKYEKNWKKLQNTCLCVLVGGEQPAAPIPTVLLYSHEHLDRVAASSFRYVLHVKHDETPFHLIEMYHGLPVCMSSSNAGYTKLAKIRNTLGISVWYIRCAQVPGMKS